jgi:hypothetical protein
MNEEKNRLKEVDMVFTLLDLVSFIWVIVWLPLGMSDFVLALAFYWAENLSYACIGILSFIHTVVENNWYKSSDL